MVELAFEALPDAADFRVGTRAQGAGRRRRAPCPMPSAAFFADGYLEEILNFGPGFDLRGVFTGAASAKPPSVLLASAVNEGGFDQFAIQTPKTVRIYGVILQLGRSIPPAGTLANAGRAAASLRARRMAKQSTLSRQMAATTPSAQRQSLNTSMPTLIDIDGGAAIRGFRRHLQC